MDAIDLLKYIQFLVNGILIGETFENKSRIIWNLNT